VETGYGASVQYSESVAGSSSGVLAYNFAYLNSNITYYHNPFRSAIFTNSATSNQYECRDSFAYWQDGTSNQIILGEKHIPAARIAAFSDVNNGTSAELTIFKSTTDASAIASKNMGCEYGAFRYIRHDLSNDPTYLGINANGLFIRDAESIIQNITGYGFGSYHSGIVNFLLGDGAVRNVSVTTDRDRILVLLSNPIDGRSVTGGF
jgi:hypothetical protein